MLFSLQYAWYDNFDNNNNDDDDDDDDDDNKRVF